MFHNYKTSVLGPLCCPCPGNGTAGLEILEDLPDVDSVIVPYGGGGLSCGIALAIKQQKPNVKVFACEVATAAPVKASFEAGRLRSTRGKAYRTLAALQDTAASVGARRQRSQGDRYTLQTFLLAHQQHTHTHSRSACAVLYMAKSRDAMTNRQKWLYSASLPNESIIWWCFAVSVDEATLELVS